MASSRRFSSSGLFFIFALRPVFAARLLAGFKMPFLDGGAWGAVDETLPVDALVELSLWAFTMRLYRLALFYIRR